ncbi:NADH:ubiquinone oxidoreductase subunit N [Bacillus manliponensis]|uniref:NADH-quinone oxidoreductase subunit N n=1 Tax=Bacillus manliponensis TaxID=574376 RepID=A0A073K4S7_9BACI|nr:NADH-quinone oxidoreductase subunit NuoN [Bacillus manliponensis]KEK21427.1 NADH:ubiquinone oxidoreductase subunit N [Bacillus manliponensis]
MDMLLRLPWHLMTPEFILLGGAILLSLLDLFAKPGIDRRHLVYGAIVTVMLAFVSLTFLYDNPAGEILDGSFVLDGFSKGFKTLLLVGGLLVLCMAISGQGDKEIEDKGEYYYLFLTALLGAMIMASSVDLMTLFIGLELLSLSSYILVGMRKRNRAANEAAMKYVVQGGISTAVTLFGMSYLYGITGSTNMLKMQEVLRQGAGGDIYLLLSLSFVLIFVGLSFKIATAPFHMWAPDVYEGAWTPVTAFLGTVSKMAGFILLVRVVLMIFGVIPARTEETSMLGNMNIYIAALACITMIIGNVVALRQQNVKRMLAYSGVAHAGYLLVPLVALSPFMMDSMWFYMLAYALMNIGAIAIIHGIILQTGNENLSSFAGLYKKSPSSAVMMTIFILSLAGIPGTAGFIGKVNIFLGAFLVHPAHYVLASVMMATTVISFIYYFRIVQQMFFRKPASEKSIELPLNIKVVAVVCACMIVLLGVLPALGYNFFYDNFPLTKDFFFVRNMVQ